MTILSESIRDQAKAYAYVKNWNASVQANQWADEVVRLERIAERAQNILGCPIIQKHEPCSDNCSIPRLREAIESSPSTKGGGGKA